MEAISNPFQPPSYLGSDDPHQAIDLAIIQDGMAVGGGEVHLVLEGSVAAVISGRFPYGNALLVETPLEVLPADWLAELALPTPAPTLGPHPSLTCPQLADAPQWDTSARSLYLLYAHMAAPPDFQLGDRVACGAPIGLVGQSGNALNPHLHLEARLGPRAVRFAGIAHYETRATPEEMWGYCTWRVSGVFQLVDPTRLLGLLP
jgi:murein DD-endopeptidase MepM/ murein hydrolase activator NlpD